MFSAMSSYSFEIIKRYVCERYVCGVRWMRLPFRL